MCIVNQRNGPSVVSNTILARPDEFLWQELNQARMLVDAILFINYQTDIGTGELAGLSLMLNNAENTSSIAQATLDTSIAG